MKYLLLICTEGEPVEAPEGGLDPEAWVTEMTRRGIRERGDRLRPAQDATTVRVRKGELLVTDGPFAETKEQMGGFDIIDCADLDEAIEVAARHPMARYGMIDIRPFWPLPDGSGPEGDAREAAAPGGAAPEGTGPGGAAPGAGD